MSDAWQDEVRVHYAGDSAYVSYLEDSQRSEAQKHTDKALAAAKDHAEAAISAANLALDWVASVGADIPSRFRNLPTVLRQLHRFIEDEQERRG